MPDTDAPAGALSLIELIAGAIRDELGAQIDAYPGLRLPARADPMNRAFRAVVRALLVAGDTPAAELTMIVSRALRLVVERCLISEGWGVDQVRTLMEEEPDSPDDWLCFGCPKARPRGILLRGSWGSRGDRGRNHAPPA